MSCVLSKERVVRIAEAAYRGSLTSYAAVVEAVQLAANEGAAKAREWQPIETAPRDGTKIIVTDETETCVAWFVTYYHTFAGKEMKAWAVNWNSEFNAPDKTIHPTRWMPLPPDANHG